jgi:hypothetical protein
MRRGKKQIGGPSNKPPIQVVLDDVFGTSIMGSAIPVKWWNRRGKFLVQENTIRQERRKKFVPSTLS